MSATKTNLMARAGDWWAEARANPYFRYGLAAAFIIALLDQLTKYWIVEIVRLPARGKIELSSIFDLTYVQNYGASFGLLSDIKVSSALFILLNLMVTVYLANWLWRRGHIIAALLVSVVVLGIAAGITTMASDIIPRLLLSLISLGVTFGLGYWLSQLRRPVAVAGVASIIGGALGNLYDRVAYGYVVDFFDFSGLMFPWVFNIADMAINIGVAFLLLDAWLTRHEGKAK